MHTTDGRDYSRWQHRRTPQDLLTPLTMWYFKKERMFCSRLISFWLGIESISFFRGLKPQINSVLLCPLFLQMAIYDTKFLSESITHFRKKLHTCLLKLQQLLGRILFYSLPQLLWHQFQNQLAHIVISMDTQVQFQMWTVQSILILPYPAISIILEAWL